MKKILKSLAKNKKILIISASGVAGVGVAGVGTYFAVSQTKTFVQEHNEEQQYQLKVEDVFPSIDQKDYYHLIEIVDKKPVITDKMIAFFIKDVIKKLGVSYGNIKFAHDKKDDQNANVEFIWEYENQILRKNYHFSIRYGL
ncbi:MHO_1590 family protein [Mycoplasma procyoni]|uniref:MHO_1590 family protein n=1 Tax=Mycoplasma procyoni TaxID=568784 RepID=UPI00197B626F|nr:hypothetical protein [Mycoplasma procyoni]MBN3535078.1 hypothetical protein [Mycoplasma procyoni]